ncbi:venom metalloproteinase BumaMPs1 isoform X2 [Rhipicephalus microplus]|uniref:venom metalloproteinase BumaMPs1 isoform X2 n=1 Tax=Rhipicephalus microplus TaxID=6941 RepID=UPI003F6BA9D7
MERFSILWLFCSSILATSHQTSSPWRGVTVYPRVLESRGSASEKVLMVAAGYSLDLRKASVLADSVLMRDLTDSGVVETYIAGKEHERHLYQNSEKMAALLLQPQAEGQYHIVGLLNSTHRIQPVKASERSSKGLNAHEILPIKTNDGVSGVIEAAHVYRERVVNFRPTARSISLPENFTIELAFCSDYYHTKAFGKDIKARVHYVITMVLAVSLRLQQLSPPGFISIVSIQGSSTKKEPYVAKLNESVLLGTETLRNLSKYAAKSSKMRQADVVFLITGRKVAQKHGRAIRFGTAGLAFVGSACTIHKVGLAVDTPKSFSAVQSMTHEIAHLLNASHDGEGSSRKCDLGEGYLMHMHLGGKWQYLFSNCSVLAVRNFLILQGNKTRRIYFLEWRGTNNLSILSALITICASKRALSTVLTKRTPTSSCLKVQARHHNILLPGSFLNLPNATLKGRDFCKKFFPDFQDVSYAEAESGTNNCHFRCKITHRKFGAHYANLYAPTGTPCNTSLQKLMRCNFGLCE